MRNRALRVCEGKWKQGIHLCIRVKVLCGVCMCVKASDSFCFVVKRRGTEDGVFGKRSENKDSVCVVWR